MIIFDTETTGIINNAIVHTQQQPSIIQVGILKVQDGTVTDTFKSLIRPPVKIDKEAVKVHGITNEDVVTAQTFDNILPSIKKLFLGERVLCGHNVIFDLHVLFYELFRIGEHIKFPFCPSVYDTMQLSQETFGEVLSLGNLYQKTFNKTFQGSHDALTDCYGCFELLQHYGRVKF